MINSAELGLMFTKRKGLIIVKNLSRKAFFSI